MDAGTTRKELTMSRLLTAFVLALAVPACGGAASDAPPAKPFTGAPIAFQVTKVTTGDRDHGALALKAYNFSDKTVAQYAILMRYTDQAGAVVKVKPGTPFEKDHDFYSMSGKHYLCKPKSWCSFELDSLEIPAAAAKAEVLASSVTALKADGFHFEEDELWSLPGGSFDWPTADAPKTN